MTISILDSIDSRQLGAQLQQARKKRGLTQEAAAQIIDAVRTTMVAIEKGERRVKPAELIRLARAYGRPVSDFVCQRPEIEPFALQFRASFEQVAEYGDRLETVTDEWQNLCRNYLELEEIVGTPLLRNYPPEYRTSGVPIDKAAEGIALAERSRLGLGDGPIPALRDTLEQEVGLRIFYLKMPNGFSEMYAYEERLGGCMAISTDHPEGRQRWSLAHGYLHFLAHRHKAVVHYDHQYQRQPAHERLADAFAEHFLMPTSSIVKHFAAYRAGGRFTPANLCTLAHYFGVSVQAMALRLETLDLLPRGTWDQLYIRGLKVKELRSRLNLKEAAERSDKYPIHYQHLAIEALDQGLITEGHFAQLLNVDRLEARRIAARLREYSSGMNEGAVDLDLTQLKT